MPLFFRAVRRRVANWLIRLWWRVEPDAPDIDARGRPLKLLPLRGRSRAARRARGLDRLLDDIHALRADGQANCRCRDVPVGEDLPPSVLRSEGVPEPGDLDDQWRL